jgi:hypothetical protein
MRLHTELVEEAIVGALGIRAAALGERRLRGTLDGSADDANRSREGDECSDERCHSSDSE